MGKRGNVNTKSNPNRDNTNDGKCYRSLVVIQNALHEDKCATSEKGKDHFAKVSRTKGGKPKQNIKNVDKHESEDFAFAIDDNHMPERLNFCVLCSKKHMYSAALGLANMSTYTSS